MHDHWTIEDWIRALDVADREMPAGCGRAHEAWSVGVGAWLAHASGCPRCRRIAAAQSVVSADVLDCSECRGTLDTLFGFLDEAAHFEPAVAWEAVEAQELWADLEELPGEERLELLRFDRRFHRWGFAQKLLGEARGAWHDEPHRARDLADQAVAVTVRLAPETYHPRWVADLQARAFSYLANAHRILADFSDAMHAFLIAEDRLCRGVGSAVAEADLLSLEVSLATDRHLHREAFALLDRAESLYERSASEHETGRILLKRARLLKALGRFDEAAAHCARAADRIDPAREALLSLLARQNLVDYLAAAGQSSRARKIFDALPPVEERTLRIRRWWVEGHLLEAEQRFTDARSAYERTRAAYSSAGLEYDVGLVVRDLVSCGERRGT